MKEDFDVIVVGAGPAGAAAALTATRRGLRVLLLERGEYPGAKNMCGGMLMASVLHDLIPGFWEEAPLERPVKNHVILMLSGESSLRIDYANHDFTEPPFNGFTVLRHEFDEWLVKKAADAGAVVVTGTVVDDLIYEGQQVVGVRTRRPDGQVRANVVIAADGVNSLLSQKAGLRGELTPDQVGLGIKELIALPRVTIDERFSLVGDSGVAYSVLGDFARGIPGGGFIYANRESISVGMVVHPAALAEQKLTANDVLERFKAKREIARLVDGGRLLEYSAHLIPEGGLGMVPRLYTGGMLIAGDAAGFAVNTGLTLQGINLALTSGMKAAEAAIHAHTFKDYSASGLSHYETLLDNSAVMATMKRYKRTPALFGSSRIYDQYPDIANRVMERLVTVGTEGPKSAVRIVQEELLGRVNFGQVIRDGFTAGRAL